MALWTRAHCFRLLRLSLQCDQHVEAVVELYCRQLSVAQFLTDVLDIVLADMAAVWPTALVVLDTLFAAVETLKKGGGGTQMGQVLARETASLASRWHPRGKQAGHLAVLAYGNLADRPHPTVSADMLEAATDLAAATALLHFADGSVTTSEPVPAVAERKSNYYARFFKRWIQQFTLRTRVLYTIDLLLWKRAGQVTRIPPSYMPLGTGPLVPMLPSSEYVLPCGTYTAKGLVEPTPEVVAYMNNDPPDLPDTPGASSHDHSSAVKALYGNMDVFVVLEDLLAAARTRRRASTTQPPDAAKRPRVGAPASSPQRPVVARTAVVYIKGKQPGKKLRQALYFPAFPDPVVEKGPYRRQGLRMACMGLLLQEVIHAAGLTSPEPVAVTRDGLLHVQSIYLGDPMQIRRYTKGSKVYADMSACGLMHMDTLLHTAGAEGIPADVEQQALLQLLLAAVLEVRAMSLANLTVGMHNHTVFQTGHGGVFNAVRQGAEAAPKLLGELPRTPTHAYLEACMHRHRASIAEALERWAADLPGWLRAAWPRAPRVFVSFATAVVRARENIRILAENVHLGRDSVC